MNTETLLTMFKEDFFLQLVRSIKKAALTVEEAQSLTQAFLSLLPIATTEELLLKFFPLTIYSPDARSIYIKYAAPYYEQKQAKAFLKAISTLHTGNIDLALWYAKGGD